MNKDKDNIHNIHQNHEYSDDDDDTVSRLYHIPPIKIFPNENNNKVKLSKSELAAMNVRKSSSSLSLSSSLLSSLLS